MSQFRKASTAAFLARGPNFCVGNVAERNSSCRFQAGVAKRRHVRLLCATPAFVCFRPSGFISDGQSRVHMAYSLKHICSQAYPLINPAVIAIRFSSRTYAHPSE